LAQSVSGPATEVLGNEVAVAGSQVTDALLGLIEPLIIRQTID
jgi:hypothetical protein